MTGSARIGFLLGALLLGACTNPYDPGQRAAGGALIGAGTGAAIGGIAGGPRGLAIGALAGGLGGAAIGAATTPQPPQYQAGYAPQGYGQQIYAPPPAYAQAPPPPTYAPAPVGAQAYYPPPGPGTVTATVPYQGPPPQTYQAPPGSYWQPQPYVAPPDPYAAYRY